jgi:hypothetical protein
VRLVDHEQRRPRHGEPRQCLLFRELLGRQEDEFELVLLEALERLATADAGRAEFNAAASAAPLSSIASTWSR